MGARRQALFLSRAPGHAAEAVTELWTMDAATGERKVLVNADTLKSVMQPEKAKTIASHRPRPRAAGQLSVVAGRQFPALHRQQQSGASRPASHDAETTLSSEQEIEDPKFSPDGKWVSFVRDAISGS